MPVGDGKADSVIRIDEVVGRGAEVELGEQGSFQAQLKSVSIVPANESVQTERLIKGDGCHRVLKSRRSEANDADEELRLLGTRGTAEV